MKWLFLLDTCTKKEHTHPFNGPFSGTTRVNWCQKGKTNVDFTEARDSEWQWHQLGHIQVCISLQTDNHASTPPLRFFTGRMPSLPPNQQRQSTQGSRKKAEKSVRKHGRQLSQDVSDRSHTASTRLLRRNVRRILVSGVNAPLPHEAKKIVKI